MDERRQQIALDPEGTLTSWGMNPALQKNGNIEQDIGTNQADTLKLEYPALSSQIDAAITQGWKRDNLRKFLAGRELYARMHYGQEEVDKLLGRTSDTWDQYWRAATAQRDEAYIRIMRNDMSEGKVRDILNTARFTGIAPGFLLTAPKEIQDAAEKMAGERRGLLGQIAGALQNFYAGLFPSGNKHPFQAEELRQLMKDDNALIEEGRKQLVRQGDHYLPQEYATEQLSDEELKELGRKSFEEQIKGLDEWGKYWRETYENRRVHVRPPDSELGAYLLSAIENSGFTVMSSIRSAIGWALSGPGGGLIASLYNTKGESDEQAGNVFIKALRRGMSKEEAYKAAKQVQVNNMLYLTGSNYGEDVLTFGLGRLASGLIRLGGAGAKVGRVLSGGLEGALDRLAGQLTGKGLANWLARFAVTKVVPRVASAVPEGFEEMAQDYFDAEALGDEQDWDALWEAFRGGMGQAVIYSMVGLGTEAALNRLRGATPTGRAMARIEQETREAAELGEKIARGEVKPDDIIGEDKIVFIPRSALSEEALSELDIHRETVEDEEGKTVEAAPEETGTPEAGSEEDAATEEIAIRRSTWDEWAKNHPQEAEGLKDQIREGTRGVTAKEELARKIDGLRGTAEQVRRAHEDPLYQSEEAASIRDGLTRQFMDAGHEEIMARDEADTLLRFAVVQKRRNPDINLSLSDMTNVVVKSLNTSARELAEERGESYQQIIGEKGAAKLDAADAGNRIDNLGIARQMEEVGKDARTIRLATGWEKGKEGKWGYEVLDGEIKLPDLSTLNEAERREYDTLMERLDNGEELTEAEEKRLEELDDIQSITRNENAEKYNRNYTLGEIYDAPELYAAYPELRNISVHFGDLDGAQGEYYFGGINLSWNFLKNHATQSAKNTLVHEIQHAVQNIEGFAKGGNPEQFIDYNARALSKKAVEKLENIEREHRDAVRDWVREQVERYVTEWFDIKIDEHGIFSEPYYIGEKGIENATAFAYAITDRMIDKHVTPEKSLADVVRDIDAGLHEFLETEGIYDNAPKEFTDIAERYREQKAELEAINAGMQNPIETYRRLAGEVQARNASARMDMSAEDRRATLLADTEDVAREDQIVLMNALGPAESRNEERTTPEQAENIRRGTEAMEKVISEQTDVMNAMHRDDVGDIAFFWGTPGKGKKFKGGKGISHIIAHRDAQGYDGQAVVRKLVEVIAKGEIARRYGENVPGGERVNIAYDGYTAVLSLYEDGERQTWLLTGWKDEKSSDASSEGNGSTGATLNGPMRTRPAEGAEVSGQSLQRTGETVNGQTSWERGTAAWESPSLIEFFRSANASTGFHELGHHMLRVMMDVSRLEGASAQLKDDVNTILDHAGVTMEEFENDAEKRTQAHEYFARSWETYLSEGKAPTPELQGVFDRIRQWMIEVYHDVVQALGIELSDDMREVFDRILATPDQLAEQRKIGDIALEEMTRREEMKRTGAEINELEARNAGEEATYPADWDEITDKEAASYPEDWDEISGPDDSREGYEQTAADDIVQEDQTEAVRKRYKGTEQFMKAPNGKDTNLTERQWLQVRTPAFKKWFGDWENDPQNASKVVDENGEPKVVYHNTGEKRRIFDRQYVRKSMEIEAHFFAPNIDPYGEYGPVRNDVFLNIKNPADYKTAYDGFRAGRTDDAGIKQREKLQAQGYDGGIMTEDGEVYEYFVFDSNQIKSATENRGTFSARAKDIYKQEVQNAADSEAANPADGAADSIEDYARAMEEYSVKKTAREYVNTITKLIKQNGGLRLEDFIHDLGEEAAKELRKKWPGLFRNTADGPQLELDVLTQQLQANGINLDVRELVDWLTDTINERPEKPVPPSLTGETLKAAVKKWGAESVIDYLKERKKYLAGQNRKEENPDALRGINKEIRAIDRIIAGDKAARERNALKEHYQDWIKRLRAESREKVAAERQRGKERVEKVRAQGLERLKRLRERYAAMKERTRKLRKIGEKIDKAIGAINRMADAKSISYDRAQEIKELLKDYDLKRRSNKTLNRRAEVTNLLYHNGLLDDQGVRSMSGEEMTFLGLTEKDLKYIGATSLNDMTLAELRELHNSVAAVFEQGKAEFAAWEAARQERRGAIRADLKESLDRKKGPAPHVVATGKDLGKQYKGITGALAKAKDGFYSAILTPDRLFDWLDGGHTKYDGAFVRYFVDELNAATDEAKRHEYERLNTMKLKLKELGFVMSDFSKKATDAAGRAWTWNEIMELYVGMRNEKKARAILFGNFVNGNGQKPVMSVEQAQNTVRELIGLLTPEMRQAAELVVQDHEANFGRLNRRFIEAFNRGMEHELDYSSIHRLEHQSKQGLISVDEEKALSNEEIMKRVETGFMLSRQEIADENQAPVMLGLFSNWMNDVSRHEHAAAAARIAGDLTSALTSGGEEKRPLIRQLSDRFGRDAKRALVSFFNDSVTDGQRLAEDFLGSLSDRVARNMSIAYIAGNCGTVLRQLTSIPRFLITAGPHRLIEATARFSVNPAKFLENVYKLDPQLRDRGGSALLKAITESPEWGQRAYQRGLGWMFAPVSIVDRWVAAIGWSATYEANRARGATPEAAIREAQRAVRLTQQAASAKDLPRLWRGGGFVKTVMAFTSDTAATIGMSAYDMAQQLTSGEFNTTMKAFSTATALAVTAIAMKAAKDGIGGDDDDEEEGGLGAWLGSALVEEFISSLPLIGKEAMMLYEELSGKWRGTTYSAFLTPVVKVCKAIKLITDEDSEEEEFWKASGMLLDGLALSGIAPLPSTAIRRVVRSAVMLDEGEPGNAAANLFGMRVKREE